MIYIIRDKATPAQIKEILAGGGAMHADCEAVLLDDGSRQEFVWGADWDSTAQLVTFESLINIRPRQNNSSMDLLDPAIREKVAEIVMKRLGGV